jgi:universal stress protein E
VLRYCAAPLMLLAELGPLLPRRIAAAVDTSSDLRLGDSLGERVLDAALGYGHLADAEVHLASAFPILGSMATVYPVIDNSLAQAEARHRSALDRLGQAHAVPAERRHALRGETVHALNTLITERSIDLLVLGSIHRQGFDRLMLGSTAEALVSHAICDLLLIKPESVAAALRAQLQAQAA